MTATNQIIWPDEQDYNVSSQTESNTITCLAGGTEMLKVGPDGFWVRGVKVEQDEGEAQAVYNAFKQWMAWTHLSQKI